MLSYQTSVDLGIINSDSMSTSHLTPYVAYPDYKQEFQPHAEQRPIKQDSPHSISDVYDSIQHSTVS